MEKTFHSSITNPSSSTTTTATTTTTTTTTNNTINTTNSNTSRSISTNSTSTTTNTHIQNSLKSLNKSSYKISKPPSRNPNPTPNPNPIPHPNPNPNPQSQPPVYNIDKSDFREIVQKLTGSPAHHRPSPAAAAPPPAAAAAAAAAQPSRLHRIRPPPLAHLSSRPQVGPTQAAAAVSGWVRPPLSPLPPLPTVSAAAESPITAYMRRLHGGPSPPSPLGFGCVPLSPSLLLPTSPRMPMPMPMPSPRCGDP